MNESKKLIQQITEGIQDKKGKNIVIADLSKIGDTICNYLVICPVSYTHLWHLQVFVCSIIKIRYK